MTPGHEFLYVGFAVIGLIWSFVAAAAWCSLIRENRRQRAIDDNNRLTLDHIAHVNASMSRHPAGRR
jgi:hypothetical protein